MLHKRAFPYKVTRLSYECDHSRTKKWVLSVNGRVAPHNIKSGFGKERLLSIFSMCLPLIRGFHS